MKGGLDLVPPCVLCKETWQKKLSSGECPRGQEHWHQVVSLTTALRFPPIDSLHPAFLHWFFSLNRTKRNKLLLTWRSWYQRPCTYSMSSVIIQSTGNWVQIIQNTFPRIVLQRTWLSMQQKELWVGRWCQEMCSLTFPEQKWVICGSM